MPRIYGDRRFFWRARVDPTVGMTRPALERHPEKYTKNASEFSDQRSWKVVQVKSARTHFSATKPRQHDIERLHGQARHLVLPTKKKDEIFTQKITSSEIAENVVNYGGILCIGWFQLKSSKMRSNPLLVEV